jgi:hypothetical protein
MPDGDLFMLPGDDSLGIPDAVGSPTETSTDGEDAMASEATPIPQALVEQSLGRQLATNSNAADHNQEFNKILNLNYERGRDIVSLRESLGTREVTSQSGQLGIPMAGAAAGGK